MCHSTSRPTAEIITGRYSPRHTSIAAVVPVIRVSTPKVEPRQLSVIAN